MNTGNEVDKYFVDFPPPTREVLELLRTTIMKAAPGGVETISYKMPAYKLSGILVWYAAYKNHIGLYPTPGPIEFFKDQLAVYKTSKGAIQFPLDKPLPLGLITKIVKFRAKEDQALSNSKIKKK